MKTRANNIASAIFVMVVLVVGLSGCGGSNKAGFGLEQAKPMGKEQPYRAVAAPGIKFDQIKTLIVVLFPLDPSNVQWVGELGVMIKNEKGDLELLRRECWRAYADIEGINELPYPALIDKTATYLWLLVPNVTKEKLIGKQATVLSGASTRAMAPDGKTYTLPKDEAEEVNLVAEFFKAQPSARIRKEQVVDLSPGTKEGDAFIADIGKRFPVLLKIGKENLMATKDVVDASEMTTQDTMVDRVISKGKAPLSLMSILSFAHPVLGTIQATQIFYGLTMAATDEEMYGPYGETKYPGWAVGETLGYYLRKNHRQIEILEKQVESLKKQLSTRR